MSRPGSSDEIVRRHLGFDPTSPALTYLVAWDPDTHLIERHETQYGIEKVGITGEAVRGRVEGWVARGAEVVKTWRFDDGHVAAALEAAILMYWRINSDGYVFPTVAPEEYPVPGGDGISEVHMYAVDDWEPAQTMRFAESVLDAGQTTAEVLDGIEVAAVWTLDEIQSEEGTEWAPFVASVVEVRRRLGLIDLAEAMGLARRPEFAAHGDEDDLGAIDADECFCVIQRGAEWKAFQWEDAADGWSRVSRM